MLRERIGGGREEEEEEEDGDEDDETGSIEEVCEWSGDERGLERADVNVEEEEEEEGCAPFNSSSQAFKAITVKALCISGFPFSISFPTGTPYPLGLGCMSVSIPLAAGGIPPSPLDNCEIGTKGVESLLLAVGGS